ncbi:NYN domain-containing protein [Marinihelvus fidelis]|uniref:NYN domain-containing protein n=1 Tax=Marinihelvus fidelis TaxID=2613842 RepID=A0A5N0TBG0_9GAMM|nr:NYN domain-containing protein [Marinihelvus fidelis]KAA9131417.1 NYN domain-containing protein [Marinihelvus fidelis]
MSDSTNSLALYCDFENIALGVRDARYARFNIDEVLERLLVKGNIVVKKAYCDWERYKDFKNDMHEASFELIDIPHRRMSGKNSADIRMVVDALDLCYTKEHVDTFVIISGDSDFSPLVSKLRENNKLVIGIGVKGSTSDLLISNCDEFIFYEDIVRKAERRKPKKKSASKKDAGEARAAGNGGGKSGGGKPAEERAQEAFDQVLETIDDLVSERGEESNVWGSMVKQALKRRKPSFSESYHGFRSFSDLLQEMEKRKLLKMEHDPKSGGYIITDYQGD